MNLENVIADLYDLMKSPLDLGIAVILIYEPLGQLCEWARVICGRIWKGNNFRVPR